MNVMRRRMIAIQEKIDELERMCEEIAYLKGAIIAKNKELEEKSLMDNAKVAMLDQIQRGENALEKIFAQEFKQLALKSEAITETIVEKDKRKEKATHES